MRSQGAGTCFGACKVLFNGQACYRCHNPTEEAASFALDLGCAQCVPAAQQRNSLAQVQTTARAQQQYNETRACMPCRTRQAEHCPSTMVRGVMLAACAAYMTHLQQSVASVRHSAEHHSCSVKYSSSKPTDGGEGWHYICERQGRVARCCRPQILCQPSCPSTWACCCSMG